MTDPAIAQRLLTLLDLTSLTDQADEDGVAGLCKRARTDFGDVAAVCVWPRFVPWCRKCLKDSGVRVATVANFPHGRDDLEMALADTAAAIAYGADEVEVLFPHTAWLADEDQTALEIMAACRDVCLDTTFKVIIETGRLKTPQAIAEASKLAIEAGADFIETYTPAAEIAANRPAATVMLSAIKEARRPVGFQATGAIPTFADAARYLELAEGIMGYGWVGPSTFRIGAPALPDDLLAVLQES